MVRFTVKKGDMTTTQVEKAKFSKINDKRLYFPDGVISLPFGHCALKELEKYKKKEGAKNRELFSKKERITIRFRATGSRELSKNRIAKSYSTAKLQSCSQKRPHHLSV